MVKISLTHQQCPCFQFVPRLDSLSPVLPLHRPRVHRPSADPEAF